MNFNLSFRCVFGLAFVNPWIASTSSLHQQMNSCVRRLFSYNLKFRYLNALLKRHLENRYNPDLLSCYHERKIIIVLTETPLLGPRKEISSSLCNHTTDSGGFSVKETTQLKLTILPISTNMSGPPITYVEGSEMQI